MIWQTFRPRLHSFSRMKQWMNGFEPNWMNEWMIGARKHNRLQWIVWFYWKPVWLDVNRNDCNSTATHVSFSIWPFSNKRFTKFKSKENMTESWWLAVLWRCRTNCLQYWIVSLLSIGSNQCLDVRMRCTTICAWVWLSLLLINFHRSSENKSSVC